MAKSHFSEMQVRAERRGSLLPTPSCPHPVLPSLSSPCPPPSPDPRQHRGRGTVLRPQPELQRCCSIRRKGLQTRGGSELPAILAALPPSLQPAQGANCSWQRCLQLRGQGSTSLADLLDSPLMLVCVTDWEPLA